jgi:hypothetical protein
MSGTLLDDRARPSLLDRASGPFAVSQPPRARWLPRAVGAMAVLVPLVLAAAVDRGTRTVFERSLPAVDVAIWLVGGAAVVAVLRRRDGASLSARMQEGARRFGRSLAANPFALFLGALLASAAFGAPAKRGLGDVLQAVDAYLVGFALVLAAARREAGRATIGRGLAAALAIFSACAWWQILHGTPSELVSSVFRDRASWNAAALICGPYVLVESAASPSMAGRWARRAAVVAAGFGLASSAAMLVYAVLALAAAWRIFGRKGALLAVVVVLAGTGVVGLDGELGRQARSWKTSAASAARAKARAAQDAALLPLPALHAPAGSFDLFLGVNALEWARRKEPAVPPTAGEGDIEDEAVDEYWAQCWASLTLISTAPPWGRGPASWQGDVGTAYGFLPRTGTALPGLVNGYLATGAALGLAGLAAWLYALATPLLRASAAAASAPTRTRRQALACGFAGWGAGLAMLVTPIVLQPVGFYVVIVSGVAQGIARERRS